MNNTIMFHWFNCIKGISPENKQRIMDKISVQELYACNDPDEIEKILTGMGIFVGKDLPEAFGKEYKKRCIESYEDALNRGIRIVGRDDEDYPNKLKCIFTPPICLYVIGELPANDKTVAVIGSRNCSDYGIRCAKYFGEGLAKNEIAVISGMARGIDGWTQRAVLEKGGKTYAVLGCGADVVYPKQNKDLYEMIKENGGVISEVPPGEPPLAENFPRRNRIISALSDGILLIEAGFRSGSLITVNYGIEQGKEIMVVPGRIDDRFAEGCIDMIKSGATPVMSVKDVIFSLNYA